MKKLSAKLLVIVTLLGLVGLFSNTVAQAATPEVLTVNITDLTKEQREAIQPGEPTPAKEGERTLLVYAYDKKRMSISASITRNWYRFSSNDDGCWNRSFNRCCILLSNKQKMVRRWY